MTSDLAGAVAVN